jgi:hypothetical protein
MPTLPAGERAVVPLTKVTGYLLSESHPVGRAKARYFRAAGFGEHNVPSLVNGLLAIARSAPVVEEIPSRHGIKYVVDGLVNAPYRPLWLRTVWIIEPDIDYPRFVTAYPAPGRVSAQGG